MGIIKITCPKCREIMEINTRSGRVERHHGEGRPKPGKDFIAERLKGLEEEKARREEMVAEGRRKEAGKKDAAEKLFGKVKEHANSGEPVERPLRDIDID